MAERAGKRLAVFRWLCGVLSSRVAVERCRANLPRDERDWQLLVEMGSTHLVLPNLYLALREKGLLADIPPDLTTALEGFHTLNALHNVRLRQQMREVSGLLNSVGLRPIWLKGATHLMAADWKNSGRMMVDLDFWLPEAAQHVPALACLSNAGYAIPDQYHGMDFSKSHHHAPLMREGESVYLEVHRQVVATHISALLPDVAAQAQVEWLDWEGYRVGRLAASDRLMHAYIQCAEMNGNSIALGRISLMKILDFLDRLDDLCWTTPPPEWFAQLDCPPWRKNARRLFTFLEHDFNLASPLPRDGYYRRRLAGFLTYPKATYGLYLLEHIRNGFISGRAGSPRHWWRKLVYHLEILRNF
ncbi:conserved hypothetical protein [Gammaproteobacteria bacterium]